MFTALFEKLADRPVATIAKTVVASVLGGTVTIVVSATGSGKTLLLPPSLAMETDEPILVLVPRRILAMGAAETVAELSGLTLGQEVGYGVGAKAGEISRWKPDTRVVYATFGYAMASGLIFRAKNVALDELHEMSRDMSICRALLRKRLLAGEAVNILEMSASINAERQAAYWRPIAPVKIIEIDGRTFPCERWYEPTLPIKDAVKRLLDTGRKGIIVFRPGQGEVGETAEAIRALVGSGVEVAELYGKLDPYERKLAVAGPADGNAKVLVSTNVVESGANITWLDAGVSCGTAKELSVRPETGAVFLGLIDLPRGRLKQQEGRVNRFRDGIFILCAEKSYEDREAESTPEILRLPMTELVMYCASYDFHARDLTLDYPPEKARIAEAELKLQRLGLLDTDCRLTAAGQWVSNMPVGPETGAMLWHAKQLGVLGGVVPLAAVIEADGIRKDIRLPHYLCSSSDWLDAHLAFISVYNTKDEAARLRAMEKWNVASKPFEAANDLLQGLQLWFKDEVFTTRTATEQQLRQCLLAGFIMNLFSGKGTLKPVVGAGHGPYKIARDSFVKPEAGFALGHLRTIQPREKDKRPFTVLEKVTDVSLQDILDVAALNPTLLSVGNGPDTYKLFGEFKLTQEKPQDIEERHPDMFDQPRRKPAFHSPNQGSKRLYH